MERSSFYLWSGRALCSTAAAQNRPERLTPPPNGHAEMRTALDTIGVILFATLSLVSLGITFVAFLMPHQYSSWFACVLVTLLIVFLGVRYVVRPNREGWEARATASGLLFILLFVLHPQIIGLPGRFSEVSFERQLHKGMPRAQINALINSTGGTIYRGAPDNGVNVQFFDSATICLSQGDSVHLNFSADDRLQSWSIDRGADSC